jgi:hypothetical protein
MSASKRFFHDVKTELKPWTNENFGGSADSDDFNFIIFGDRAGRPLAGVTEEAIAKINLLNPDFVMSVGDFIPGCCYEAYSPEFIQRQWDAFEKILKPCEPPFFRVVGNHDIPSKGSEGGVLAHTHDMQTELWQKQFGATYYSFVFKDVLFICLHTMESYMDISETQLEWARETLIKYSDVKWTMVFGHLPKAWDMPNWEKLADALDDRNYTVFAGDFHNYVRCRRRGRNYYIIGMTGTESQHAGYPPKGVYYGEFQSLTWVSFKNGEPQLSLLALDEVYNDDVVTIPKLTWLTPSYFQADQPISAEEADKLEAKGLKIHREIGEYYL